ncbi:TOX high mobility group box member 4, partial [Coemansia sp. S146]
LADAFTTIADVFELVGARAKLIERTHDAAELERELGPKPKLPLTISKLYHLDHVKAISAQNPDLNCKEVKKLIAAQWENISEEERQTYRDHYSALRRRYKVDIAAYDARRKAFMQTRSGGFMSTARLSEPHSPTLSASPGPPPEPERSSTPILPSSPSQPTVRFTEPQRSTLFLSPRPSLQPPLHQPQLQPMLSMLSGPATQLAVRLTEPERSMLFTSSGPPLKPTEQLNEDEMVGRELGPKPKPPAPVSRMYCESMTKEILKENPKIHSIEAVRLAHVRWNNLSEDDRQLFNDRFDTLKRQYDIDIAEYNARKDTFLSTYRELISTARPAESEPLTLSISPGPVLQPSEQLNEDEVVERELGPKPKPPAPVSRMYCESMTKEILKENPRIHSIEAVRLAHVRWNNLSEDDRQLFNDRFDTLKRQYDIDIAAYSARKEMFLSTYNESVSTARLAEPEHPTSPTLPGLPPQPTERRNEPECTMASMSSRFNGLLSSPPPPPPPPVESFGSSRPIGPPVPSQSTLPSGTVSRPSDHSDFSFSVGPPDVAALAHSLTMSWSEEATLPDESPESSYLPLSSGGLPRPTMAIEHSISSTQASATVSLARPVIPLESIPVGMSLEFPNTTETVAFVKSPDLSFSTDPPAPEVTPPVCAIPVNPVESAEPAELLTPTKTKSKKKKKRAAEDNAQESTNPHRKETKRAKGDMKEGKKHKPKIVVKTDNNVEEATTNKENGNAGSIMNAVMDTAAQMSVFVAEQSAISTV